MPLAWVAQLVEHFPEEEGVGGSSPPPSTIEKPLRGLFLCLGEWSAFALHVGLEPSERCRRRARRVPRHRVPLRILGAKYVGDRRISPPNRRRKHESVSAVSVCSLGAGSKLRTTFCELSSEQNKEEPTKKASLLYGTKCRKVAAILGRARRQHTWFRLAVLAALARG